MAPAFKPAYLIHGDDHGRIAERRSRLRALAERESGAGGLEVLEDDAATPAAAAAALSAMTLSPGRRFIVVDGVERWKAGDLEPLAHELGAGARLDAEAVEELTARSAERRAWTLADALVARDAPAALRTYEALTAQGERIESLIYHLTRRLREALGVAERLEAGEAPAQ